MVPEPFLTLEGHDYLLKAVKTCARLLMLATRPINIMTFPFYVKWIYVFVHNCGFAAGNMSQMLRKLIFNATKMDLTSKVFRYKISSLKCSLF